MTPFTMTRIRVPSRFVLEGVSRNEVADFRLGLGPCGKTVTALRTKWTTQSLIITQVHEDKTLRRFIYPRAQITGRIEEEYSYGRKAPPGPSLQEAPSGGLPLRA